MTFLANPINTHWMGCYPGYGSMTKIILLKGKKMLSSSILESSICTEKKKQKRGIHIYPEILASDIHGEFT